MKDNRLNTEGEPTMKTIQSTLLAAGLVLSASATYAAEQKVSWLGRVGPTVGFYAADFTVDFTDVASGTTTEQGFDGDQETAYGLQAGLNASYGNWFGDLAVDYLRFEFEDDKVHRTDLVLTAGYRIGDNFSVFAGFRKSTQGDGVFNDDVFEEDGPLVGAGVGGIAAGALVLGASLAANFSELEFSDAEEFDGLGSDVDYDGLSLKLSAALKSRPNHSLQLRLQRYEGDDSANVGDADGGVTRIDIELEEKYVQLYYIYSFAVGG